MRVAATPKPGQEPLGQQEMAQVIDPEMEFETIRGQPALPRDSGIVDQHMQRLAQREECLRAAT